MTNESCIISKLGYCCINNTLRNSNPSIYSSRSIIKRIFTMKLAAQRSESNVKDIIKILEWNEKNSIKVFRIGSEPLPRSGDQEIGYSVNDLYNSNIIIQLLKYIGKYVHTNNHHISFHPGQYVCLGSPNDNVRQLGIYALEKENEIADYISSEYDVDIPINIHVGGSYGLDFDGTSQRFINTYNSLSESLKRRLCIENDDKKSGWSVRRLYHSLYEKIGIPITFDIHHWKLLHDDYDIQDDFNLAYSTWNDRNMQVHYSESPSDKLIPKHSDYYKNPLPDWLYSYNNIHIHLECKAKELALQKLRNDFYH